MTRADLLRLLEARPLLRKCHLRYIAARRAVAGTRRSSPARRKLLAELAAAKTNLRVMLTLYAKTSA